MGYVTDSALAWAAGVFEGEGSAIIIRANHTTRVYLGLELHMTDEDIVRRFSEVVGIGSVRGPYEYAHFKPRWKWRASGAPAIELVTDERFCRWLGRRRRGRIAEILAVLDAQGPPNRSRRCQPGCECRRHKEGPALKAARRAAA